MTAPPDVVRLSTPSDIASTVPHLLGFVPSESIVVLTVHGTRKRLGLALRLDLLDPDRDPEVAAMLGGRVMAEKPREVYVAVFTEAPDDGDLPRRRLVDAIAERLDVPVADALLVRAGRWWSYVCGRPSCCPPEGGIIDTATPGALAVAAAHALHGNSVLPDRDALMATLTPLGGITAVSMEQAVDRAVDRIAGIDVEVRIERGLAMVNGLIDRYADPRAVVTHDEAAYLQVVCHDVRVRDPIMGLGFDDDDVQDRLSRVLLDVARRAVPGLGAPAWTMFAWVAYGRGDATRAVEARDRALRENPEYSLAHLLGEVVDRQIHPARLRQTWGRGVTDGGGVRHSESEQ